MATEENQENQGFRVKDQRRFNPDGSLREGAEADSGPPAEPREAPRSPKAEQPPEPHVHSPNCSHAGESHSEEDVLPADIVTLILSLASTAQMGLGIAPHPATGKAEKNLLQARHAIDMLGVLQEKTKGNLSKEEEQLLEAVVSDLRMRFVTEKQKG